MEILISLLVGIALMEGYAWLNVFSNWLLDRAVRGVNSEDRDRCREEWTADLNAMPNTLLKGIFALKNFTVAADRINREHLEEKWQDISAKFDEFVIDQRQAAKLHREITLAQNRSRDNRQLLSRTLTEGLSSLQSAEQSRGASGKGTPATQNLVKAFETFGNTLIEATNQASNLLQPSIDDLSTGMANLDTLIASAGAKHARINNILRKRDFSIADRLLLEGLANDLNEMNAILTKVTHPDSLPFEQHQKIITAIHVAVSGAKLTLL
jgi:hypothetical protein